MSISNIVESIQLVEATIASSETTTSGYLTKSQNYQNCIPFMTINNATSNALRGIFCDAYFSGTTTSGVINFERAYGEATVTEIKCYIIEFNPAQVRVQQGTFDPYSAGGTDSVTLGTTLNSVNKAAMTFAWKSAYNATSPHHCVRGWVDSTTTINFKVGLTSTDINGHYFLFEDLGSTFEVDHYNMGGDTATQNFYQNLSLDGVRHNPFGSFTLSSCCSSYNSTFPSYWTGVAFLRGPSLLSVYHASYNQNYEHSTQVFKFLDDSKVYTPAVLGMIEMTDTTPPMEQSFGIYCNLATSSAVSGGMQGLGCTTTTTTTAFREMFQTLEVTNSGTLSFGYVNSGYVCYAPDPKVVDWAGITISSGTNSSPIPEGSGSGQSFVKSVEHVSTTVEDYNSYRLLTKGQNWENCTIMQSYSGTTTSYYASYFHTEIGIYPPGVVLMYCGTNNYDKALEFDIIEFWPNQVKVQQNTVGMYDITTSGIAIAPVSSLNKAFLTLSSLTDYNAANQSFDFYRGRILTTSGVDIYRYNKPTSTTLYRGGEVTYFVVEDLQDNFYVLPYSDTISAYSDYLDDFSNHWMEHNTFVTLNNATSETGGYGGRVALTAQFNRESSPYKLYRIDQSNEVYYSAFVVKFTDNKFHTENHYEYLTSSLTFSDTCSSGIHNTNALSVIPYSQYSLATSSVSNFNFACMMLTTKISSYAPVTWEIERYNASNNEYFGFVVIDWMGSDQQEFDNIQSNVATNSMIQSIETFDFEDVYTGDQLCVLTKGQNIDKCIPIVSQANANASKPQQMFFNAYRYSSPDCFKFRFGFPPITYASRFKFDILEFSDEVTVQHGYSNSSSTTLSVAIDEVVLDRSFLVFYSSTDDDTTDTSTEFVCGRFTSVSGLEFERAFSDSGTTRMYVSWYVVECSEESDLWTVDHYYNTATTTTTLTQYEVDSALNYPNHAMFFLSYSSLLTNSYPYQISSAGYYNNSNATFDLTTYATGDTKAVAFQIINVSSRVRNGGFRCFIKLAKFTDATALTIDVDLPVASGNGFDLNRSLVFTPMPVAGGHVSSQYAQYWGQTECVATFKDEYTITVERSDYSKLANTYTYPFIYEFPEYNKYYIEGYVQEAGSPVQRNVTAYRTSTKEEVSSTTSNSGTGYFFIETPYGEEHFVVAFDDDAGIPYNALIYDGVIPTVISGTFAYNEGLVTTSGFEIGVPLGRQ